MTAQQNTSTVDIVVGGQGTGANSTWRLSTYNPIALADSPATVSTLALTTGANTVQVQSSIDGTAAKYVLILPDPSNGISFNVKTIVGDTGITVISQPMLMPLNSVTYLYVNASANVEVSFRWL